MEQENEKYAEIMKLPEKNTIVRSYMGRPSKLSESNMILLKKRIAEKKMCTVNEVQIYIKERFNVSYSSKEVREILKKFNLNYYPLIRKYTYESYYNDKIIKKFEF